MALDRPVFVVGPPRSGTTLVGNALSRHPELHVTTETHLFDVWVPRFPGLGTGDEPTFRRFWAAYTATEPFGWLEVDADAVCRRVEGGGVFDARAVLVAILAETARTHQVPRVGEKTPDHAQHLGALLAAFPDARVVHVRRDPRATVASELRLDRDWASDDPWVAAERWRRCIAPLDRWAGDERVLTMRYEDLVRDPEPVLRDLCRHVGLAWHPAMLEDEGGHPTYRHGDLDPWGPIRADSLETWRSVLDVEAFAAIHAVCGRRARAWGYPPPLSSLGWADRLRATVTRVRHRV